MADDPGTKGHVSRRNFLAFGVGICSAIAGSEFAGLRAATSSSKVSKQTVSYQPSPKGTARCGTCSFFEAPGSCNYVDGPISPAGWCMLYKKKG